MICRTTRLCAVRFTSVTACVYTSIVTMKLAWRRSSWIVFTSSPLFHRVLEGTFTHGRAYYLTICKRDRTEDV
jgi:hypothetical protein